MALCVCITTTWSAWRQVYLFDWVLNVSNATKYWNCVSWMNALNLDMGSQTWLLSLTFWYSQTVDVNYLQLVWSFSFLLCGHRVRLLPWSDPKPWFCLHSRPIICWKHRVADAIFIPLVFLTYLLTIEEKLFDWVCIVFSLMSQIRVFMSGSKQANRVMVCRLLSPLFKMG